MKLEQFDQQLVLSFFDQQPQPAFWMKPVWSEDQQIIDFEYTYCNLEFYHYSGLSPDKLLGKYVSNSPAISSEEFRKKLFNELLDVYQKRTRPQSWLYNPDWKKYYSYTRNRVEDGVLTVLQDRTEEYKMMQELEEQKNLMDNILRHSSNAISVGEMIRDESGKIIDIKTILVNEAAVRYTGISKDQYLTKTGGELDPNFVRSPYFDLCVRCMETGESALIQYHLESAGRWMEVSLSKMDENHQIYIFTDVTPIKEAQLQLEKNVEELRRSNKNLEEFAHAASHDLKEPIRKVQTFAGRLKDKLANRMDEGERNMFERMESANERMRQLVDDLLIYSRVSIQPAEKQVVDLNETIRLVLTDLEVSIEESHAHISVEPLPTIKGYSRQLQQLFQNLISNSLKYTKPGLPPAISITSDRYLGSEAPVTLLEVEKNKPFHLLQVTDHGIGFEQQYAERIFGMFQRLHGRSEYSGTGIGLAIARKIVENHEGYIWATGEQGKGATFYLLLPVD